MAAIPFIPGHKKFQTLTLNKGNYARFLFVGNMELIKSTIRNIYKEILPNSDLEVDSERTLIHYEYYDYRFRWNNSNSEIDILIPVNGY